MRLEHRFLCPVLCLIALTNITSCVHPKRVGDQGDATIGSPAKPLTVASAPEPAAEHAPANEPPPPSEHPIGCWERLFGSAPTSEGTSASVSQTSGCEGCELLRAGPKAAGLHVEVLERLRKLEQRLPTPNVDEPVLWINSGKRDGSTSESMHNQGLAVDIVICGLDTIATAQHLRDVGFPCVIEYYDRDGKPCHMAHADLRGTAWATGAYGPEGRKARTCPRKASGSGDGCQYTTKADWNYRQAEN